MQHAGFAETCRESELESTLDQTTRGTEDQGLVRLIAIKEANPVGMDVPSEATHLLSRWGQCPSSRTIGGVYASGCAGMFGWHNITTLHRDRHNDTTTRYN